MSSGSEDKRRVQFRAPHGLVERTDVLATVLKTDRTDVIISALREYLRDAAHDDDVKQEIAEAYYDDEITFEELKELVGHEEAANFRVLKTQLNEAFLEAAAEEFADS
jgi:predicted transcriptional regulator